MRLDRDGFSVDSAIRKGRKLPDWYLDEPQLLPGEDFYTKAFYRLSTERQIGMSFGPIPWMARIEYGERAGLDGNIIEQFADIIGLIDGKYVSWREEQAELERKRNQPKSVKK